MHKIFYSQYLCIRPVVLVYGNEDRNNLGPLIKYMCGKQQVYPSNMIRVIIIITTSSFNQDLRENGIKLGINGECIVDVIIFTQADGKVRK